MGGFRFPLETLLRYRVRREEAAWRRLGESARALAQTEQALAAVRRGMEEAAGRLAGDLRGRMSGAELVCHARFGEGLRTAGLRLDVQRREQAGLLETRRQELLERRRERQLVEESRRQAWAGYRAAEAQRAQRQIDEIAITGYLAGRREGVE